MELTSLGKKNPKIYSELQKIAPELKIWTLVDGGPLDTAYVYKYSSRMVDSGLDDISVAYYIKNMYGRAWDNAFALFAAYDGTLADGGSVSKTTVTKDNSYTDTISDTDKIPAFDVDEPQLDKQANRVLDHVTTSDTATTVTDNKAVKDFPASWEYLKKHYIDDIIFRDTNNLITYSIHN